MNEPITPIRSEEDLAKYWARPVRILLVEDDLATRDLFRKLCQGYNIDMVECVDATEAMYALQGEPFDHLLIDVNLPGMDGVEFYKTIREADILTPAIFVSQDYSESVMRAISMIDPAFFVLKPAPYTRRFAEMLMSAFHAERRANEPMPEEEAT